MSTHRRPELRQIYDLVAADFERHPVWVGIHGLDEHEPWYEDEGLDEATVRPWLGPLPVDAETCMLFVAADFVCADGARWRGHVTPGFGGDIGNMGIEQPTLLEPRPFNFWSGIVVPSPEDISRYYVELGKEASELFPLQWRVRDGLLADRCEGRVEGFGCLQDRRAVVLR